jgi:gas vesicle protein
MDKTFKKGLVFGGILGSAIALFASSEKGKQIGKELREELEEVYDDVRERALKLSALTRENYEKIVDSLVSEFSERKNIGENIRDKIISELKSRYHDIQIYYLYSKIRSRIRKDGEFTRDAFEEAVDDLVDEFAENKQIAVGKLRQMKRQLRSMWNEFKKDLEESDEG